MERVRAVAAVLHNATLLNLVVKRHLLGSQSNSVRVTLALCIGSEHSKIISVSLN